MQHPGAPSVGDAITEVFASGMIQEASITQVKEEIKQGESDSIPVVEEPPHDSTVLPTNEVHEPPLSPFRAPETEESESALEVSTPVEQEESKTSAKEETNDVEMEPPLNDAEPEAPAALQPDLRDEATEVEVAKPTHEEPVLLETAVEKRPEEVEIQNVVEPPIDTNNQEEDGKPSEPFAAEPVADDIDQVGCKDELMPTAEYANEDEPGVNMEESVEIAGEELAEDVAPEAPLVLNEDVEFKQEEVERDQEEELEKEMEDEPEREHDEEVEREHEEIPRKKEYVHAPPRPLEGPTATYGSNPSEAYPYSIHWGPPPPPPFASPVRHGEPHKGGHDEPPAGMHQYPPPPPHGYPYYYGPPPGYPPSYPYYPPPPHVTPGYGYPPPPPPPGQGGQTSHPGHQQGLLQQPLYSPVPHSPNRSSRYPPPPHSPYYYGAPPPYLPPFPDTKPARGKEKSPKSADKENENALPSPMRRSSVGDSQHGDTSVDTDSMMTDDEPVNIRTYIKPITTTNPDILQKRHRKNQQSRSRAQKHKERVAEIMEKRNDERTAEEQKEAELFENRRSKKNDRSRQRAIEKKEAIDKILTKPESQRSKLEIQFLEQALSAKKRKNEGDRMRRERLKMLGLQNRGDSNGNKKPKVSARGPLPPELADRVAATTGGGDLGPPPMPQHDYPPHGYYPPPPGSYGYPHPSAGYPPPAWESYGPPPSGPGGPGLVADIPESPDRA